jgi:hypothetical protein
MSSHREAPEMSQDPVADSTDLYAFVSPHRPDHVTIIANYIPLQAPFGGPNFFEFGQDVSYRINIDNDGDGHADIVYQFRFDTVVRNPETFLYNTGPITSIDSPNWNRPQFYTVRRMKFAHGKMVENAALGRHLAVPPCNIGQRSTPNYAATFTPAAVHSLGNTRKVFAGQRADAFHVDLGSIFDLGALRPFNEVHLISMPDAAGVNGVQGFNVHSIALEIPKTQLTRDGSNPTRIMERDAVVGVWTSAERQKVRVYEDRRLTEHGEFVQVSRLGNPLVNEVIIAMSEKDRWNKDHPFEDDKYAHYVDHPELQKLLPALYPGVFPHLARYDKARADLDAILLTGIPVGVIPGFQNYTGATKADMLRLNMAVPPTPPSKASNLGLLGGDVAGFPNGRRVHDDIVAIELRAIAGLTIPLVDSAYTPDAAAKGLTDGTRQTNPAPSDRFPFLGPPGGGYQSQPGRAIP